MQTHKYMPQKRLSAWEICSVVSLSGLDLQHRPHFENRKMALFKCLVWISSRVNRAKRFTHTRLSELCGRKWTLSRASLLRALRDWLWEAIYMSGKHTLMHKTTSGVSISGATLRTCFMPVCGKTERKMKTRTAAHCVLPFIFILIYLLKQKNYIHREKERPCRADKW